MAHEIDMTNGRANMAYVGETPWHGLGSQLEAGASIETWLAAAGMEWRVQRARVRYAPDCASSNNPDSYLTFDDRVVLLRSDTKAPLGIASDDYKPVHPRDALELIADISGKIGVVLNTAGCLFDGRHYWAMGTLEGCERAVIDGRDIMKRNLLCTTSADGSRATIADWTDVRAVCNNTVRAAMRDIGGVPRVKISHRSRFNVDEARVKLGVDRARTEFEQTMTEFRRMAETRVEPVQALLATAKLFTPGFDAMDKAEQIKIIEKPSSPTRRIGELMLNKQAMGSDYDGTNGTAWGWLNALTQYIDHEGRSRTDDRRLESAWYGPGQEIKQAARQVAMEMVQADGSTRTVYQAVAVPTAAPAIEQHGSIDLADILAASPAEV